MDDLKNYQEIKEYVIALEKRIYEIEIELYNIATKIKNSRKIKKELRKIKEKRDNYVALIDSLTTFEKESLLSFFLEYLPTLEEEEIEWKHIEIDYQETPKSFLSFQTHKKWLEYLLLDGKEEIDIISNTSGIERIEELLNNNDIYGAFKKADLEKGFYLEDDAVHLANGVGLKRMFMSYPSIEYAFIRLIDLGIANEKLAPQERLDMVLAEVKRNKENVRKKVINLKK